MKKIGNRGGICLGLGLSNFNRRYWFKEEDEEEEVENRQGDICSMSENNPSKRWKGTASIARDVVPPTETSIYDLPEELLHKILGGSNMRRLERWTELSLVCRSWRATMQSLVLFTLPLLQNFKRLAFWMESKTAMYQSNLQRYFRNLPRLGRRQLF
jgi:hypothetical protein